MSSVCPTHLPGFSRIPNGRADWLLNRRCEVPDVRHLLVKLPLMDYHTFLPEYVTWSRREPRDGNAACARHD
jgi:hypothetical protein